MNVAAPGRATGAFAGWRIVALAVVTGAMTGPGQTIGVSVFVDPFIDGLGLTRSQVSGAYLVGTLAAAGVLPAIGTQVDRVGVRRAMTAIGVAFGLALVAMSGVQGLVTLAAGFFLIRLLGQGALTLVSTVAVTHWFEQRRGFALGVLGTGISILMALVPVGLSVVIDAFDWRWAWIVAALAVWATVVPIARFGMIDRPADVGQEPDGGPVEVRAPAEPNASSVERIVALRSVRFWALAFAMAAIGMLSTALNFHQISLLGDAGMSATEAAVMFLPQVIGAALAGLAFGWVADRLTGRSLVPITMALLTGALLLASVVRPGPIVIAYAVLLGAAGGAGRSVSATLLPRWFGTLHIGAIQGTATLLNVASTAIGPVAFALARDAAGNYDGAARWFALIPVTAGVVGAIAIKPLRPAARRATGTSGG